MPAERIDIPPEAEVPKPLFESMPDSRIVDEIRKWLSEGHTTASWRGHTHTKPDRSSPIVYVNDFQMPKGKLAPCPCCWPNHGKFGTGMIAWFPDEHIIRLIGPRCYRTLNAEGHDAALAEFQARQRRDAEIAFIEANYHRLQSAESAISRAIPIAEALDEIQAFFSDSARRTALVPDVWNFLRNEGRLLVIDRELVVSNRPSRGSLDEDDERDRYRSVERSYARVDGYMLVDPHRKKIAPGLKVALSRLEAIPAVDDPKALEDGLRRNIARAITKSVRSARDLIAVADECRRFLSPNSLATLRNWGRQSNAPISFYIAWDGDNLLVGQREGNTRRVDAPRLIERPLLKMPDLDL